MSEQAVTYADLKFQTPSKQQRKKTPKNTRNKGLLRDKTDRPWIWGNGTAFSTDQ
ncbi:hypothetical protein UY3_16099 [Chelonia mydas]|uniref:Uncharacterized protein n=1 Tax=Chelonia mydas TaxID=8469 RepID=M7ANL2_CHEMY|nr:hypothetical protein UY3_16099 [Chelonia mydas]